jgi:hypothetical protein
MISDVPTPPVPDLARAKGATVLELVDWFVKFYNTDSAPFNYRCATRSVRAAYKGIDALHLLTAACAAEKTAVGRTANADVVKLAAPLAFGRSVQVFDLSRRRFAFGRNRFAAYRVPFFFVEKSVIHLYYLQPRKAAGLDSDELGMVATIAKKYLLDVEFFGSACDVEFVDVSANRETGERTTRKYSLATLPLWSDRRLTDRLTMLSEALDLAVASGQIVPRRRIGARPEPEMPLFD